MRNMVIKGLVLVLAASVYFNITQFMNNNTLQDNQEVHEELITSLEKQHDDLEAIIKNLQEEALDTEEVIDTCLKLNEITITIVDDEFEQSYVHCTNKVILGDALDELVDILNIEYDPRYDKDYMYGRMVVSFYNHPVEYGEYYAIYENDVYASFGIDKLEITDETIYSFKLVGW